MEGEDAELARLVAQEATQRLRYQRLKGGRQSNGLTVPPLQDAAVVRAAKALWQEAADRLRAYKQDGTVSHGADQRKSPRRP
jgi:hypothetical protein